MYFQVLVGQQVLFAVNAMPSERKFVLQTHCFLTNLLSLHKLDLAQLISLDRPQIIHHLENHTLPFARREERRGVITTLVTHSVIVFKLRYSTSA